MQSYSPILALVFTLLLSLAVQIIQANYSRHLRQVKENMKFEFISVDEDHRTQKTADREFINRALELHNSYRATHGVPPLVIDEKLNEGAQSHAELLSQHNYLKHFCGDCNEYGQNLAYKGSTCTIPIGPKAAEWAVESWYNEVCSYNFSDPFAVPLQKWGHFTAVVWKGSKKMGIGVAYGFKVSANAKKMNTVYVVAQYAPLGNMLSALEENVLNSTAELPAECNGVGSTTGLSGPSLINWICIALILRACEHVLNLLTDLVWTRMVRV